MLVVPERQKVARMNLDARPGMRTIVVKRHIRLGRRSQMHGDFMICSAMSGNGVQIGMGTIPRAV